MTMPNIELAKIDPSQVYRHPADILGDARLSRSEKIDILQRWAYDEREKAVADEENMPDRAMEDRNVLDEVLHCLILLGVTHDEHSAPTKQG